MRAPLRAHKSQPEVNEFLDQMLRDRDKNLRFEEVVVRPGSNFIGVALKDTPIRSDTGVLVVAVHGRDRAFVYNPDPNWVLTEGARLVVLGETDSIVKLRLLAGEPA